MYLAFESAVYPEKHDHFDFSPQFKAQAWKKPNAPVHLYAHTVPRSNKIRHIPSLLILESVCHVTPSWPRGWDSAVRVISASSVLLAELLDESSYTIYMRTSHACSPHVASLSMSERSTKCLSYTVDRIDLNCWAPQ